jgi:hypothetical protein
VKGRRRPGRALGLPRARDRRPEAVEDHLLEAGRLLAAGRAEDALRAAGEAVYRDPNRPEGFQLLGEAHLQELDFEAAIEAFEAARRKARSRGGEPGPWECLATGGLARAHLLAGRLEEAVPPLRELLVEDEEDEFRARPLLAEVHLRLGEPARAEEVLAGGGEPAPDTDLVGALVAWDLGEEDRAARLARRAFLGNLFLAGCLVEGEPPRLGIEPADPLAGEEFARDLAFRLESFLESRPERARDLAVLASLPIVAREQAAAVEAAVALKVSESGPARERAAALLCDLRCEARLAASAAAVLAGFSEARRGCGH